MSSYAINDKFKDVDGQQGKTFDCILMGDGIGERLGTYLPRY